jgi:hypothetical protein
MWWAGERDGWILQTATPVTQLQMLRMIEYTRKDQTRQIGTMQAGPTFDIYAKALASLTPENVTHRIEQPQGGAK